MYRVELYAEVRRSVYVEGLSERAAARRFGLAHGRSQTPLQPGRTATFRDAAQRPGGLVFLRHLV